MRLSKQLISAVCGLILSVFVVACGVPSDSKPRAISPNQVLFDLLATSTTMSVSTIPTTTANVTIALISGERLVSVERTIASPPSPGTVLAALLQAPNDKEASSGLRSAIGPQAQIRSALVNNGIVTIDFENALSSTGSQDQILAVAQLVYTLTSVPGVTGVQVALNGAPSEVPRGDGSTTKDPVRTSDYGALAPIPQPNP